MVAAEEQWREERFIDPMEVAIRTGMHRLTPDPTLGVVADDDSRLHKAKLALFELSASGIGPVEVVVYESSIPECKPGYGGGRTMHAIFASTALVEGLAHDELKAMLAHQLVHIERGQGINDRLNEALASGGIRRTAGLAVSRHLEHVADRDIQRFGADPSALAAALKHLPRDRPDSLREHFAKTHPSTSARERRIKIRSVARQVGLRLARPIQKASTLKGRAID